MSSALFSTLYKLLKPEFSSFFEEYSSNQDAPAPDSGLRHDFRHLRQQLEQSSSDLDWQTVQLEIQQQLQQLLDIQVFEVLVSAWSQQTAVETVIKRQQEQTPNEVAVVPLPPHKIRSDHKPVLRILINQQQIIEVTLDIRLLFKLRGVVLKINHGKICSIMTGEAIGVGRVSHRNIPLAESRINSFKLLALNLELVNTKTISEDKLQTPIETIEQQKQESILSTLDNKKIAYFLIGICISISLLTLFSLFIMKY